MNVCTTADLLPFGKRLGDKQIPPAIDKAVGPLKLSTPIIFYQNREYSLYVSVTAPSSTNVVPRISPLVGVLKQNV
jgi:hypothetical protein